MMRITSQQIKFLNKVTAFYYENPVFSQTVRWRKRRWAPVNESRKYYVREKTEIIPEEYEELKTRFRIYNTQVGSLRKYFKEQLQQQELQAVNKSTLDLEIAKFKAILDENEEWNRESAKLRETRELKERAEKQDAQIEMLLKMEQEDLLIKEASKRMVLSEQKASKNFININNLEEEIEKVLDSRTNYNYAIDLEGNKYIGMPQEQEVTSESTTDLSQSAQKL